jgi:hypothetical protein
MGIPSEKWIIRQFLHCAKIIECPYTNLDSTQNSEQKAAQYKYKQGKKGIKPVTEDSSTRTRMHNLSIT